jgi:hypothetical protein
MRRKNDANKEELEGVAQRLRNERPEASPLQLDQIKMSAMSRAKAGTRRHKAGARRLATAGLTIGLLAAGTGGVIAGGGGGGGGNHGNASNTQYGSNCIAGNGNGNGNSGNGNNGNGNGNFDCSENNFIIETNTTTTTTENSGSTVINNFTTVSATPAAGGVEAAKSTKPALSLRDIRIHLNLSRKTHLRKITLKLDGKTFKVLKGKAASKNINLTNLPCSSGATTITVVAVTSTGKTVTESHTFHLCQA